MGRVIASPWTSPSYEVQSRKAATGISIEQIHTARNLGPKICRRYAA